jgi:hypothetical protein
MVLKRCGRKRCAIFVKSRFTQGNPADRQSGRFAKPPKGPAASISRSFLLAQGFANGVPNDRLTRNANGSPGSSIRSARKRAVTRCPCGELHIETVDTNGWRTQETQPLRRIRIRDPWGHRSRGQVPQSRFCEEGWRAVKPYVREKKMNYRVVLGTDKVATRYGGIDALPTTLLIESERANCRRACWPRWKGHLRAAGQQAARGSGHSRPESFRVMRSSRLSPSRSVLPG